MPKNSWKVVGRGFVEHDSEVQITKNDLLGLTSKLSVVFRLRSKIFGSFPKELKPVHSRLSIFSLVWELNVPHLFLCGV